MKILLVCLVMMMTTWAGAEIAGLPISEVWADTTPATHTITLLTAGTLKSLLTHVPTADVVRFKILDNRTGVVLKSLTSLDCATTTSARTALDYEFNGEIDIYIYVDPKSGWVNSTITGMLIWER